jgi:hypothetical protein
MINDMKTLNEEINDIKTMKATKTVKAQALFKLGLRKHEVELILSQMPKATAERVTFTFGVEIECLVPRIDVETIATRNNLPFRYEGYNHVDNNTYFKFVSDASIQGANPIACVSPILKGKNGFKSLENCCNSLNEANAQVNKSCGLHVHIGASKMTGEHYANVFYNYAMLENAIDSFMARSRRANNSQWCRTLQDHLQCLELCKNASDVLQAMNNCRYHKVNAVSYVRHKTIEFRQHQGSTDFTKIKNWVNFCAKLVAWSKKNRIEAPILTIEEIPFLTATEKKFFINRRNELA